MGKVIPLESPAVSRPQQCLPGKPHLVTKEMGKGTKAENKKPGFTTTPIEVKPASLREFTAPYSLVSTMRASICVLGPLLAKLGKVKVSMPGGCVIGPRPIDLHLKGLKALGAKITIDHGYIEACASTLKGTEVYLGGAFGSSVLATANVMMAATLAEGTTIIENAACEPEIVDLAEFLIKMGAKIEGHSSPVIKIEGVRRLHGAEHEVIPDRIEAGTYMIAAAMTGSRLTLNNVKTSHLGVVIDKLKEAGVAEIFGPGTPTQKIVDFIKENVRRK